ncbi:response regulator [Acidobacteria bacterium AH-259-D05]|nr:response regulator [Acidobacteria bacterium AH-259-D05]
MPKELRLLILEDVPTDAELMERELRKAEIGFSAKRVQTEESFCEELEKFTPDLILADYSLPSFDGISALSIAQQRCPDIPFIFVSGEIGEELAIETLKKGATDYVLKTRMSRLAPCVRRAMREAEEQAAHKRGQEALRKAHEELKRRESQQRTLLEITRAVSAHLDREDLFRAVAGAIAPVVPFDRMGIIIPRAEEHDLLLYAFETHKGKPHWQPGATFPQAGTVPGWVLEHKQLFLSSSLDELKPFPVSLEAVSKEDMQSCCALPLLVEDQAVGVLILHGKAPGLFNPADLPLLEEIAVVVALALDNALAYEEIRQLKDQLAQETIYLQEEIKTEHNFDEIIGRS